MCCLLAPAGKSITFVLAHTVSRLLCNPQCRMWHTVKKAAYAQTEFLAYRKSVRLLYFRSMDLIKQETSRLEIILESSDSVPEMSFSFSPHMRGSLSVLYGARSRI